MVGALKMRPIASIWPRPPCTTPCNGRPVSKFSPGSVELGTQTHLDINVAPCQIKAALKDLASPGLPIHASEHGVSLSRNRIELRTVAEQFQVQAARVAEAADAFMDLPLLFDDQGRPKPTFEAPADALKRP